MRKIYPKRICPQCGREFQPRSNNSKYCQECTEIERERLGWPVHERDWRRSPIKLNEKFKGSNGHHIDATHIVYIPAELHQSIPHNHWSGKGMKEMNAIAMEYLQKQAQLER
jgi:hypothetical protein